MDGGGSLKGKTHKENRESNEGKSFLPVLAVLFVNKALLRRQGTLVSTIKVSSEWKIKPTPPQLLPANPSLTEGPAEGSLGERVHLDPRSAESP